MAHSTFVLLGLAVVAVWVPAMRAGRTSVALWPLLLFAATIDGLAAGVLAWPALLPLGAFAVLAWLEHRSGDETPANAPRTGPATLRMTLAGVLALALALHLLPGFANPAVLSAVTVSADAPPVTQYLNFDKGAAGLFLLAMYCRRLRSVDGLAAASRAAVPIAAATCIAVIGSAVAIGYVRPDFKTPSFTAVFLATNLLFTCVAEEAFFRGLLQERLTSSPPRGSVWRSGAILASAGLFGLAHVAGGAAFAALASIAGLGYAWAYDRTRCIEAAIFTHFAVNAVQFLGFTYPHLGR